MSAFSISPPISHHYNKQLGGFSRLERGCGPGFVKAIGGHAIASGVEV